MPLLRAAARSLILSEESSDGMRFRMVETLREYAEERLTPVEGAAAQKRHLNFFLRQAEENAPKLTGPEQAAWLDMLAAEHDNLLQAMSFCLEQAEGGQFGLRLGAALIGYWLTRGFLSESRERLSALLACPQVQEHTKARADALNGAGLLADHQGDYAIARSLNEPMVRRLLFVALRIGPAR